MKKRIIFVINYFYPDYASTGQLLTELCLELQQHFDITVIAVQPEAYKEQGKHKLFDVAYYEQIKVIRIRTPRVDKTSKRSRATFILFYFFAALCALMREKKAEIIYTISSPPILGGLIGAIGKIVRRTKHVYNIQDFNPEQAEAISYTKQKWLFRLARKVDTWSCRWADHIVTVGRDMQQTLYKRFEGGKVPPNSVINNWTDEKDIVPLAKDHAEVAAFLADNGLENKFIVMYSGNLGLYYDLENIIRVTEAFKDHPRIAFVFVGDGAVKPAMMEFVEQHGIGNAYFLPFQDKAKLKYSLNAADAHLVVNQKGIKGVSVPSKIYGVMATGKPILGMLEQGSEASNLIRDAGCGLIMEPNQYEELKRAIERLYIMNEDGRGQMGASGRLYLEKHLAKEQSLRKYKLLLESI
ncbi:Glycosyltransferase involved in cell wall bisynthesis [Paenibacillus sp. UNC496MF]|uniref:glycosyltransferase family 4 protein n=1 Tax=Paenibacillus sp. UNC496MF TaxID=1502753 RepID=UPI0008F14E47|nr:glycosyltransferase family 4 protein [Paenibacillus sp. UNC496MF]SFI88302.1 Glycosyltransferase involved in cell wall bisynthesis [Paenibacillus sp. UNC496MF]